MSQPPALPRRLAAPLLALWAWSLPAPATVPVDGHLTAGRACPATVSIKQRDPAGGVHLEPGRAYRVLGKNKTDATHYQIVIEGARPAERWVKLGCGTLGGNLGATGTPATAETPAAQSRATPAPRAPEAPAPQARSKPGAFVLALTWQPAFCEISRRKTECRDQTPQRPDASRFSLHGLWPQPRDNSYCGVDPTTRRLDQEGDWTDLPQPNLSPATRERLAALMPGSRSALERHEWISHGTCYGTDAESYFDQALDLVEQVNASPIRALFAEHRGRHLSATDIAAAFDATFGRGTGGRVRLVCDEGMIGELRLSLRGQIGPDSRLGPLMQAAPPLSTCCRGGRVDEAGFE